MKISNKCPRNAWGYRTKGAAFSLNIVLNSIDNKYFCEIKVAIIYLTDDLVVYFDRFH